MAESKSATASTWELSALGLMFVYLKLTKQIDWSWWWVLSPWALHFLVIVTCLLIFTVVLPIEIARKLRG
jgi:hypothetical protein